jgi:hypothetical protein
MLFVLRTFVCRTYVPGLFSRLITVLKQEWNATVWYWTRLLSQHWNLPHFVVCSSCTYFFVLCCSLFLLCVVFITRADAVESVRKYTRNETKLCWIIITTNINLAECTAQWGFSRHLKLDAWLIAEIELCQLVQYVYLKHLYFSRDHKRNGSTLRRSYAGPQAKGLLCSHTVWWCHVSVRKRIFSVKKKINQATEYYTSFYFYDKRLSCNFQHDIMCFLVPRS